MLRTIGGLSWGLGGGKQAVSVFSVTFIRGYSAQSFKYVSKERIGDADWVTFRRPDLHNAFNEVFIEEVSSIFNGIKESAQTATAPRAVVLTGEGPSFSAGADLNWMKKMATYTKEENKKDSLALFAMMESIRYCPIPVIARVNGPALGGGSGLVAACDIAVALESATFGFTEVKLGLVPAVISRFVIDRIDKRNAARYFVTGERFNAKEALRIGLIQSHHSDAASLDQEVNRLVDEISKNSPAAVTIAKNLVEKAAEFDSAAETREYVASLIADVRVSPEGQEGLSAFLNKRKPSWWPKK